MSDDCKHKWVIWPETDGQEERCLNCGAYRATPPEDKFWKPGTNAHRTDHEEVLRLRRIAAADTTRIAYLEKALQQAYERLREYGEII